MTARAARRWLTLRRFDDAVRRRAGVDFVCGADEVGRGPLAGPLVAAAVCLPPGTKLPGVDDSKALDPEARASLALDIRRAAAGVAWSVIGPRAVDALNPHRASLLGIARALGRLARRAPVRFVLVDGAHSVPDLPWPQETVIGGDAKSLAIAAASIVAKRLRDVFMERLALDYPQYGFERHKGYGTPEHLEALAAHGPCAWHRYSYAPVRQPTLFEAPALLDA